MSDLTISGYIPGAIGRLVELHGTYYHAHWHFGAYFEALVATELASFVQNFDASRDGLWVASDGGNIVGGVAIVGSRDKAGEARLRWFIVAPECQGRGLGKRLMQEAVAFCRRMGYQRVYLTTFAGLDAARHLYESVGFRLCEEFLGDHWGEPVREQVFELLL